MVSAARLGRSGIGASVGDPQNTTAVSLEVWPIQGLRATHCRLRSHQRANQASSAPHQLRPAGDRNARREPLRLNHAAIARGLVRMEFFVKITLDRSIMPVRAGRSSLVSPVGRAGACLVSLLAVACNGSSSPDGAVSATGGTHMGGTSSSAGGSATRNTSGGSADRTKQSGGGTATSEEAPNKGGSSSSRSRSFPGGSTSLGGGTSNGGAMPSGGNDSTAGEAIGGGGSSIGGKAATGGTKAVGGTSAAGGTSANAGTSAKTGGTGGASEPRALAATPPMGWNSWNTFNCNPSDSLIRTVADAMVSSGMAAAGYEYVNIDDCWMNGRDASGSLRPDPVKFPNGIKAVADYVHQKGLKLGIYEVPAAVTCAGRGSFGAAAGVGSLGHETQDAQSFAAWGVDYLKYDYCWGDMKGFKVMKDALDATGRPIFYSINPASGVGASCVPPTCSIDLLSIAHMWRIGFDISATWSSVLSCIDLAKPLAPYAGPGHWNDPDMLEVGKGLSADEDRAHFGIWAMLAAPLIAGNDIRSMSTTTRDILTNPEVIAVNQDPLGKQGTVVATPSANLEVWSKQLSGTNTRAVALFNRSESATSMTVQWSQIGLPAGAANVRNLYTRADLGSFTGSYTATSVPRHGIVMLKIVSAQ